MASLFLSLNAWAQDDLMDLLDDDSDKKKFVSATFKGSRVILGHSVETKKKGELEFLISHRFGRINSGAHELFGLDNANIRLGLEYGVMDNLNIGIGRSSFDKSYDGFAKYKIISQSTGKGSFPISVVWFNSVALRTAPKIVDDENDDFNDRLAMVSQFIIGRKFSDKISFQIMPTFVHKNKVPFEDDNDQLALGAAGRFKLTGSLALNLEYYYRFNPAESEDYTNSFSIGFDIETGGHVFQLHFTNGSTAIERSFITENRGKFFDGDIQFGFNISRTFQLGSR